MRKVDAIIIMHHQDDGKIMAFYSETYFIFKVQPCIPLCIHSTRVTTLTATPDWKIDESVFNNGVVFRLLFYTYVPIQNVAHYNCGLCIFLVFIGYINS